MTQDAVKHDLLTLDLESALRLAQASRIVGSLETLEQVWPFWAGFSKGPLAAMLATTEAELLGFKVDLAEALFLGPENTPSRPNQGMRLAIGITSYVRELAALPTDRQITPSRVSEVLYGLSAPHLARTRPLIDEQEPSDHLSGAPVWTLAPKWLKSGLPALWVAGLALASWERDGPEHKHRSVGGRLLLSCLGPRLGLPGQSFTLLGVCLDEVAFTDHGGMETLLKEVREEGAWRRFVEAFLAAAELSADWVKKTVLSVQQLNQDHQDLIDTWIRAPRHPKRLLDLLVVKPVIDIPQVANDLDVTQRTAGLLVSKLEELNLLVETTNQKRGRRYAYAPLLELLQPGWTENFLRTKKESE